MGRSNITLNDSARTLGSDGSWAIEEGNFQKVSTTVLVCFMKHFMKSQFCLQ